MRNTGLDEAQAGIKIARRKINNLRYADDTTLMAEDIKKRWQEYTEELYIKDLDNPDNHDGVITHLEPDILNVKSSGP